MLVKFCLKYPLPTSMSPMDHGSLKTVTEVWPSRTSSSITSESPHPLTSSYHLRSDPGCSIPNHSLERPRCKKRIRNQPRSRTSYQNFIYQKVPKSEKLVMFYDLSEQGKYFLLDKILKWPLP